MTHPLVGVLQASLSGRPARVPECGAILWRIFTDLCETRTYHAAGPNPISFLEIDAYARLMGWPLQAHHVQLIRILDREWMTAAKVPTVPRSPASAAAPRNLKHAPRLTPAAFDVVMA